MALASTRVEVVSETRASAAMTAAGPMTFCVFGLVCFLK